eukprot:CAMPEP_0197020986 /NCGR_PEP_ID=MMETSP1384-20130603/1868_1 /TAXON_ID=29189 /ORGANISM="Ammonia sp." /LENGTH=423 /DNA_ID=CAMNT_0042448721 /DNA_START=70 /DNA_END=1341 /DNA_ORIENTATION=-
MSAPVVAFLFCIAFASAKYCDNSYECSEIDVEEDLLCRGFQSCASSSLKSAKALECSGNRACAESKQLSGADVYCLGPAACSGSTRIDAESGSVTCSAASSCSDVKVSIAAASNIFCTAPNSCESVGGSLVAKDQIQCAAQFSCNNIGGEIKAYYVEVSGEDAAKENTFVIGDKGFFTGDHCAESSDITSGGNIECEGPYSCSKTKMTAKDDVRLFGYAAGHKAYVYETPVVYAHGYYSAAFADIDASSSQMAAQFYGHYSGYFANVWCEFGSQCTVSCKSTGCLETVVFYEHPADVTLEPAECWKAENVEVDGIACPTMIEYTAKNKAHLENVRLDERHRSMKWNNLDDIYDQGTPGEPQQAELVNNAVVLDGLNNEKTSMTVWFSLFATLLGCIGVCVLVHCYYNRAEKTVEKFDANLMYT